MADEYFTVNETAEKLGVSIRTVQRWCMQGRLNHTWVEGVRHKELRVLPPITLDKLPGGKRKGSFMLPDGVARTEFTDTVERLNRELLRKDIRIDELSREIEALRARLDDPTGRAASAAGVGSSAIARIVAFIDEFERVRPAEQKLIIKLASTLGNHNRFLRTQGYEDSDEEEE